MSNEELIKTTTRPILWTCDSFGMDGRFIHDKEPISKEKALELINDPSYARVDVAEIRGKVHVLTFMTDNLW